MRRVSVSVVFAAFFLFLSTLSWAQSTTANLDGHVTDSSGAAVIGATVTATSVETGTSRSTTTGEAGIFHFGFLRVGDYNVTATMKGFKKETRSVRLTVGANANLEFALPIGEVAEEVKVEGIAEAIEPTRSMVSTVIDEQQISSLPVNGRQFIDFALLAPGVTVGNTTSGSTDVIIEPVTKLSFAGQNIHFNFIAVDGADNISTASGVQRTTPSQEAVREFRVINSSYSTEFGRAVGGIVNIISKSGTNSYHGSVYEYFRNDVLDATNILQSPGLNKLRQNQFGFTIGGPIKKDKTFFFGNYEGQRRRESPFYNSIILNNINQINAFKTFWGLPAEPTGLNVTRTADYDNFLIKLDHMMSEKHNMFVRYFFNHQTGLNVSPLNDGFDLPSAFKNNDFTDHSLVGGITSTFSPTLQNELRLNYGRRFFDFTTASTQPHLEVVNEFAAGVNRGNPDYYREWRFEVVDNVTKNFGNHTLMFGGNFNYVNTTESFPLFYPSEVHFDCISGCPFPMLGPGNDPSQAAPFVMFFQRNDAASGFTEPTVIPGGPAAFQGVAIPQQIRDLATGTLGHTYDGLFIMDKWRPTPDLTLNFGVRWEFETWPSEALNNPMKDVDPRFGFAYRIGTSKNLVLRGGAGLFHGIIPSPLLMCQIPSCGGLTQYPGREAQQDTLNANTLLWAFASAPAITNIGFGSFMTTGTYPDAVPLGFCPPGPFTPGGFLAGCGFWGTATIVRFNKDHARPYGIQTSLGLGMELFKGGTLDISYLGVRGRKEGSFYNVNQPAPSGTVTAFDSNGDSAPKNTFFAAPGIPGTANPDYAVFFEADSRWSSQYDGLLINFNKAVSHHFGAGVSYTWSKGIDNGPNPSFVLIPQDNINVQQERALSSDHVAHRFVMNTTITTPTDKNPIVNNWEFATIVSLETPHYFTKFAGFDANGDIFDNNDRVGVEPRNTFQGDGYQSVDLRISRAFNITEKVKLQGIAEAFNLLNTTNIKYFNTTYGASDFCNFNPVNAVGPAGVPNVCALGVGHLEGSPNPNYGTPRAVYNPRQLQFALRLTF